MEELKKEFGFQTELEGLLNKYSKDNDTNTPDFILSSFIAGILGAYKDAMDENIMWHSDWKPL